LFQTQITTGSGSGDEQLFNCDDTLIITDDDGARTFPKALNPLSDVATRLYASDPSWSATNGFFVNQTSFFGHNCPTDKNLMFYLGNGMTGTSGAIGPLLGYFDFTNQSVVPSFTQLYDFTSSSNCLGSSFVPTWDTNGGSNSTDQSFGFGWSNNGGQGGAGAVYVTVWTQGSGCRMLNLSTSPPTVTGDYGVTGSATGSYCAGATIHNVKMFKGANAILVDYATPCGSPSTSAFVWTWDGLDMEPCGVNCSGHWTEGMSHWANNPGNSVPNVIDIRPYNAMNTSTGIIGTLPSGGTQAGMDMHFGWNFLDDTAPFFSTSAVPTAPNTAWANEVLGFDPSGTTAPMRFASTNTVQSAFSGAPDFDSNFSIGAVSQDGKKFMFTSYWGMTLGGVTGTNGSTGSSSCIPNGPVWKANTTYAPGSVLNPTAGNTGHYAYITTVGGVSGATQPGTWNQTIGGTTTDNSISDWTNAGAPNCRGDVFMVDLAPYVLTAGRGIAW